MFIDKYRAIPDSLVESTAAFDLQSELLSECVAEYEIAVNNSTITAIQESFLLSEEDQRGTLSRWFDGVKTAFRKMVHTVSQFFGKIADRLRTVFDADQKWLKANSQELLKSVPFKVSAKPSVVKGELSTRAKDVIESFEKKSNSIPAFNSDSSTKESYSGISFSDEKSFSILDSDSESEQTVSDIKKIMEDASVLYQFEPLVSRVKKSLDFIVKESENLVKTGDLDSAKDPAQAKAAIIAFQATVKESVAAIKKILEQLSVARTAYKSVFVTALKGKTNDS